MSPRNADQDRWLADAANALAEAEKLTGLLALLRPHSDRELAALQSEIMRIRREIQRLQCRRAREARREFHPDWMTSSAWCR